MKHTLPDMTADSWKQLRAAFPQSAEMWKRLWEETESNLDVRERCLAAWGDGEPEREPELARIIEEVSKQVQSEGLAKTRREVLAAGAIGAAGTALLGGGWHFGHEGAEGLGAGFANRYFGDQLSEFDKVFSQMPDDPAKASIRTLFFRLTAKYPENNQTPLGSLHFGDLMKFTIGGMAKGAGAAMAGYATQSASSSGEPIEMLAYAEAYMHIRNSPEVTDEKAVDLIHKKWPRASRFLQTLLERDETKNSPKKRQKIIKLVCEGDFKSLPTELRSLESTEGLNAVPNVFLMLWGIPLPGLFCEWAASTLCQIPKIQEDWQQFTTSVNKELDKGGANVRLKAAILPEMEKVSAQLVSYAAPFKGKEAFITAGQYASPFYELALNKGLIWVMSKGSSMAVTSKMFSALESALVVYKKISEGARTGHRARLVEGLNTHDNQNTSRR